tara:strand:+ start:1397 stop:1861 length:465 start_codon:yes stop_codon:yes gene_type:complete
MIGYIYKLVCSETDNVYYGSTTDPLRRYNQHCSIYNNCSSKILVKPELHLLDCICIENYEEFKKKLKLKEKEYIKNNNCVNKNIPLRTNKEYYQDKLKENPNYLKELYIKSGGKNRNERTRKICECGGTYIQRNKKKHDLSKKHLDYVYNNNLN